MQWTAIAIPLGDVCHVHVCVDMRFPENFAHADMGMTHESVKRHHYWGSRNIDLNFTSQYPIMYARLSLAVVWCVAFGVMSTAIYAAAPNPQAALNQLLEEVWFTELAEFPLFATNAGEHRYNDKLPDMSPAAYERRREQQKSFATKLAAIPVESLDTDDRINYEFLSRVIADNRAELDFGAHLMPITNRSGFHVEFPELAKDVPLETLADYENYLARLAAFGKYVDDHIALMRLGMQKQIVLPDVSVRDYAKIITPQLVDDPRASRLYAPFEKFSAKIPAGEHERLRTQASTVIKQTVVPASASFMISYATSTYPRAVVRSVPRPCRKDASSIAIACGGSPRST